MKMTIFNQKICGDESLTDGSEFCTQLAESLKECKSQTFEIITDYLTQVRNDRQIRTDRNRLKFKQTATAFCTQLILKLISKIKISHITVRSFTARGHKSTAKCGAQKGSSDSDSSGEPPQHTLLTHKPPFLNLFSPAFQSALNHLALAIYPSLLFDTAPLAQLAHSTPVNSVNLKNIQTQTDYILRLPEVIRRTGLSRSSIYNKVDENSPYHDPFFAKKIKLGLRAIGFLESEIDAWIQLRSQKSNQENSNV